MAGQPLLLPAAVPSQYVMYRTERAGLAAASFPEECMHGAPPRPPQRAGRWSEAV